MSTAVPLGCGMQELFAAMEKAKARLTQSSSNNARIKVVRMPFPVNGSLLPPFIFHCTLLLIPHLRRSTRPQWCHVMLCHVMKQLYFCRRAEGGWDEATINHE